MIEQYYTIVTDVGTSVMAAALASGEQINIANIAVGDANGAYYKPQANEISLKNEVWRGAVTKYNSVDGARNTVSISTILPANVGGFIIREAAIFDSDNKMIAIANIPDIKKVAVQDGIASELEITLQMVVSNADVIKVEVNPNTVVATKLDIEAHNTDPNAHAGLSAFSEHINNASIHITQSDRTLMSNTQQLSISNKAEIDSMKSVIDKLKDRINKLEDNTFTEITGNPFLITFTDLSKILLTKGVWNKSAKRLEV